MIQRATIYWTKGSLSPTWTVTVLKKNQSALDITSATFTGVLHRKGTPASKDLVCTVANYAISSGTGGIFTYAPVAGDVAMAGSYIWDTRITISAKDIHVLVNLEIEDTYA